MSHRYITETGDCSGIIPNYNHVISYNVGTTDVSAVTIEYCITGDYDTNTGSPSKKESFDVYIEGTLITTILPGGTDCVEICGSFMVSGLLLLQVSW